MSEADLKKLKRLNRAFLKRLKLLKLTLEERVNLHSSDLSLLNDKIEQEVLFFKSNKIEENEISTHQNFSSEFINYLKLKELIETKRKKEYKEPRQPVGKYINVVKNMGGRPTLIQFQTYVSANNLKWKNSYELIKCIEKFFKFELKRNFDSILTWDDLYKLEKEVEENSKETLKKIRSIRRYLFLHAQNRFTKSNKQLYKKSKVYELIKNFSEADISESRLSIPEYLVQNGKRKFSSDLLDKDLMRIKLEIGIEQFAFKYFGS